MPKKAKKGGKGGGKMEEERRLYLQQRAQAEEEMAKKREETLTLFLKDKLQKEERNTAVNLQKLNEGWRSILRQTRGTELHEEIVELSQKFETDLEGLDSIVKSLERDLQGAERQLAQVRRVHLQRVERLWALQDKRLMFVQQQWENSLQHLSTRFISERKQKLADSQQPRAYLEGATLEPTVEQRYKEVTDEIDGLYSEGITDYKSSTDQRELEETPQGHEDDEMVDGTSAERSIQMTNAHMKKVERLQDTVAQLRKKLNSSKTKNRSVEEDLTAASNQVKQKTLKLQKQLTQNQTAVRKQLTDLSVHSDTAAKKLRAVIAKSQRVLRVADMCRKLENEQNTLFPPEERSPEGTGPETEEPAEGVAVFPELQQVSRSISAAVLQREALKKHRDDLSRENRQLKLQLRRHQDDMAVSGGRLGRTPDPAPPGPAGHHQEPPVIEAVHAVQHSL